MTKIISDIATAAAEAAVRVAGQIERTDLIRSDAFSNALAASVYFKLENL